VPDRELAGQIREISPVAKPDFTSWPPVRNFDLIVELSDTDPRLRSGMSASARIELNRIEDVIVLPASAVFTKDGATVAYVLDRNPPSTRALTVVGRNRDQVAVGQGLSPGERVALQNPTIEAVR
jgi:multidrug efflux pump subunit AcrA (membrane-fusion protein)